MATPKVTYQVRLDIEIAESINKAAADRKEPLTRWIEDACRERLEREKK